MLIKIASHLLDFNGKEIFGEDKQPVEARTLIANAIVSENNEHILTAKKKNQAFQIGLKLYSGKEVDFTVDQLAFIKERVGFFYNALIYGRICELLEGKVAEVSEIETVPKTK